MITVKLFGLLRLDTGLRELQVEAANIRQLKQAVLCATDRISKETLRGCVILVNGTPCKSWTKLKDGDQVTLMPPVAGG